MDIRIVGRPSSKAVTRIVKTTDLGRFTKKCHVVVNYGLAGRKLDTFIRKHPSLKYKPTINKYIGCNKYKAIKDAENIDIKVPETRLSLLKEHDASKFLTKRLHSQGGYGIVLAKTKSKLANKYYQVFITDRIYELRVHAFSWLKQKDWLLQKRFGKPEEIAWNYSKGGRFQTIHNADQYPLFKRAKGISEEILKIRNMSFGAVDFVVTKDRTILFLEVNSAPGFTELSEGTYVKAFQALKNFDKNELLSYCN